MYFSKDLESKVFEIWLTEDEKKTIEKKKKLNDLCTICNNCGYTPVIYISGSKDLIKNTVELLKQQYNSSNNLV